MNICALRASSPNSDSYEATIGKLLRRQIFC